MSKTILTGERLAQFRRDVRECVRLAAPIGSPVDESKLAVLLEAIVNALIRAIPDCFIDDDSGEVWISEG